MLWHFERVVYVLVRAFMFVHVCACVNECVFVHKCVCAYVS